MKLELPSYNDVNLWRAQFPQLCSYVKDVWKDVDALYQRDKVYYFPDMEFGAFNLRHASHPASNLSEARAMHELLQINNVSQVDLITERDQQVDGHDLVFVCDGRRLTLSVKLATITDQLRGFVIAEVTRRALKRCKSDFVAFVDNINKRWILVSGEQVRDACYISNFFAGRDKAGIFYDNFGGSYDKVTIPFIDYDTPRFNLQLPLCGQQILNDVISHTDNHTDNHNNKDTANVHQSAHGH